MKILKQIYAILLAIIILALSLPVNTVFAADADMRYGRKKLGEMSNGTNLQYVYDQLVAGCESAKSEITINLNEHNVSFDEIKTNIYPLFYSDYPEYFWVNGAWSGSSNGKTLTIIPVYTMTGSALSTAKSKYNAKVNELTSGLSGLDYDKAKTLHDRLIDTVTYVSTDNDQNAYGALVEGKAVCNGYSKAYQHLMIKAGIPAWYVRGNSINPTTQKTEGHAWNLVKLDGEWYYTDVTWDDQGEDIFYTYFNITTKQLLKGHSFEEFYAALVPQATATAANYYIKEGRSFTNYNQTKLVNFLKKDNNKTQIYIDGDIESYINSVNSNLLSIGADLGATGSYSVSYNLSQLGNGLILDFVVISEGHVHGIKNTISQVNATCLTNGTKAYYVCDCGLRFLDKACTQQITDSSHLEIKASAHIPSGWKNDTLNHWKECTQCGNETANTRSAHSDNNKDNKCDTCSYALPVADANGNIIIDGGTSDGNDNNSANNQTSEQNTNDKNNTSSINSISSGETESTVVTEETASNESETITTDETTSSYEESYLYAGAKPDNSVLKWILFCGGTAAVVAVIAVSVILIIKNKA